MKGEQTPLTFPCDFPIKVMGRSGERFETAVTTILHRHTSTEERLSLDRRFSKGGKYTSITILLRASSREQLDAIYRELSACEEILMAL